MKLKIVYKNKQIQLKISAWNTVCNNVSPQQQQSMDSHVNTSDLAVKVVIGQHYILIYMKLVTLI
jgi:hypothetical protein